MMGRRSDQRNLFSADSQYLDFVGRDSFYGFMARHGGELFLDEDFAEFYCGDNGRRSVPPSLLAVALLLQAYDRVSDDEAKQRADFDVRWKVALGIEIDDRPFAKSTLQLFRAQLVIHEKARQIFRRSLEYAREVGYLKSRKMRVALDTTVILGRGAVKDTYNLLGDGIANLCRALAQVGGHGVKEWASRHCFSRYFGSSLKGGADVDWDDPGSLEAFLTAIIEDGKRLLGLAVEVRSRYEVGSEEDERIRSASELLSHLLWQDVEPRASGGWGIKRATCQDRVPSVTDPEQRHGHKSHGKSFTGYKGAVGVDVDSQLITAVEVLPGNAFDGDSAGQLVESSEENAGAEVEQVIGDTAYGSMAVREELGDREVIAPTVRGGCGRGFTKEDFEIDVAANRVVCPAGQETRRWSWSGGRGRRGESGVRVKRFEFAREVCESCRFYEKCVRGDKPWGRLIKLHRAEEKLQAARALERSDYFRQQYGQRVVVEHRIARLVQLGIRQSRFLGRIKTLFQLLMAAAVANLTLVARVAGGKGDIPSPIFALVAAIRRRAVALWGLPELREAIHEPVVA